MSVIETRVRHAASRLIALFAMKFHLPIEAPVATAASILPTLNVR